MSSMRSFKKRAMEKLATSNINKRDRKKKEEIIILDDDLDNLLTNTDDNVSQSKNDSDSNILNDGNGQHEDNDQNNGQNDDNSQNNGQSNDDGQNNGQSNDDNQNNSQNNDDGQNNSQSNDDGPDSDDDSFSGNDYNGFNDNSNNFNDGFNNNYNDLNDDEEAAEMGTNNQNSRSNILQSGLTNMISSKITDSRSSSHILNDYTPSRTRDSRSDRNFKMISEKSTFDYMPLNGARSSIPRANSPFDYIPSNRTASRLIPLGPKNNTINIFNNITLTQDVMNFNTVGKIIPSPFNEMTTYQLYSWLCANPNVLQMTINMNSLMKTMATKGLQTITTISNGFSISSQEDKKRQV
ncbi:hypothetical protein C1645_815296 [Glomus cerebriforme]|uniref:Uncharacterized protein n=1 Tax=Glomus cerebriforme TaxID=658196 RepID=A0A397TEE0_9GLOM|nr:hypothetical protein C1645_815296 [Glomus cerebriforme]